MAVPVSAIILPKSSLACPDKAAFPAPNTKPARTPDARRGQPVATKPPAVLAVAAIAIGVLGR